ncbi:MAG TPA: tRNA (adenosine(37)-N6)-threonylcarbamoyltransferase complex ATPase subunit type 1 TsaE [Xanthomonadaceae bacterium]|nr:tRNA (adenosine(37)-N6)-threonylcarbamoyltransferase complex ATPase subunit type 1 TsaE [Xanthomonadaceae bacterium]
MTTLHLADPSATEAFGHLLAQAQPARAVVHLHGDLGAGKSSLARAWLRALGVTGAIRSPTYTLVEHYPYADARLPEGGKALHLDLYRIGDAGELEFLALDDAAATLWLVEWPERGGPALPQADLRIDLAVAPAGGRTADLVAGTAAGRDWLAGMTETPAYRALLTSAGRNIRQVSDP